MSFIDILFITPVIVCLYASLNLLCINWYKNRPKFILGLFLLLSGFFLIIVNIYQAGKLEIYQYLDIFFMSFLLVWQPLFYMYVWALTHGESFSRIKWLHFLPAFLVLLVSYILYTLLSPQERIYYLGEYMNGNFNGNKVMEGIYFLFRGGKYYYALQVPVYFYLSRRQIVMHRERIEDYFSYTKKIGLGWLYIYNMIFFLGSLTGVVINFVPTPTVNSDPRYLAISFVFFTLFYGAVGIIGSRQRKIYTEPVEEQLEPYTVPFMNKALPRLKNELLRYFSEEKPYLNPHLEIWDICLQLKTNRTYISRIINEEMATNFSGLVNRYRVDELVRLLHDPNFTKVPIEHLSGMAGFNSVVSMNRWFQKYMNDTPGRYRSALHNKNEMQE